jgi:hypothetical protein
LDLIRDGEKLNRQAGSQTLSKSFIVKEEMDVKEKTDGGKRSE